MGKRVTYINEGNKRLPRYHPMTDEEFREFWAVMDHECIESAQELHRVSKAYNPDDESDAQWAVQKAMHIEKHKIAQKMLVFF